MASRVGPNQASTVGPNQLVILTAVRNQQTTGIAEAFTFINRGPVRPGDYLYKLSGADDLWLGCWGLIRAHQRPAAKADRDLIAL